MFEILAIHRQHIVELGKIRYRDPAGAQIPQVDIPSQGRHLAARIGRRAGLVRGRAARVDLDFFVQTRSLPHPPKHPFRPRGATDVAHANKQNSDHRFRFRLIQPALPSEIEQRAEHPYN